MKKYDKITVYFGELFITCTTDKSELCKRIDL